MGVDKVILRAVLTTLAAIGILLVFIVVGLCSLFPSTSMRITYDMGMESSCIHFAERAYKSSHEIYYIAYATEVAIEDDKTEKIATCGEKFIKDENFEEYCNLKGENYRQFIYGQVCVSKYDKGEKEESVALAVESLEGGFPEGNALVAVLLTALKAEDEATVGLITAKLVEIQGQIGANAYLQKMLDLLNSKSAI